jgi:hypothetical protein
MGPQILQSKDKYFIIQFLLIQIYGMIRGKLKHNLK